jgi:hypothetical protein
MPDNNAAGLPCCAVEFNACCELGLLSLSFYQISLRMSLRLRRGMNERFFRPERTDGPPLPSRLARLARGFATHFAFRPARLNPSRKQGRDGKASRPALFSASSHRSSGNSATRGRRALGGWLFHPIHLCGYPVGDKVTADVIRGYINLISSNAPPLATLGRLLSSCIDCRCLRPISTSPFTLVPPTSSCLCNIATHSRSPT